MSTIRATMTRRLLGEASGPLMGIYLITHRASGKRYVGQSVSIARRWSEHRKGCGDSRRLTNALKKHGPDAFDWEIVELCDPEELNAREAFYVWAFDCLSPSGYNLLSGGGQAQTFSPEARQRLRESCRLRSQNQEWRERNAEAVRRACSAPEWQQENQRRRSSPEFRAKHALACQHLHTDPAAVEKRLAGLRRALCDPTTYTLINVRTGERFTGTRTEILERCGVPSYDVGNLAKGRAQTAKGWRLARPEEIQ